MEQSQAEAGQLQAEDLPLQQAAQAAATRLPPWRPLELLFQLFGSTAPERLSIPRTLADMHLPGPDLTNFPNSAFTLPQGGIYMEFNPGGFSGKSDLSGSQWNWPYLLRYGLTDDAEIRVLSSGLTVQSGTTGFSPVGFDSKIHLGAWDWGWFNAAAGLEGTIQTASWLASPAFKDSTQYMLALLVDHALPWDVGFEWNIAVARQELAGGAAYLPIVQWAFQRNVSDDVAVYVNGAHSALPSASIKEAGLPAATWPQQQTVGLGAQWTMNSRLAFFGGYNWGLTRFTPQYTTNIGFAVSF